MAHFGNTNFGYIAATSPGNVTTIERIDYSNDIATALARGAMTGKAYRCAGAGNQNFGYIMVDSEPGPVSTVHRVQYSNDTVATTPKGPLTYTLSQGRATGNANFAYVGGGGGIPAQLSTTNRIDYSNDTATAVTKGLLSTGRKLMLQQVILQLVTLVVEYM